MKKLLIIVLASFIGILALAQENKNLLNAGIGINLDKADMSDSNDLSSKCNAGPSFFVYYSRIINQWLSVNGGFSLSHINLNKKVLAESVHNVVINAEDTRDHLSVDLNAMFRPFYNVPIFNRLEFGGGLTADYLQKKYLTFSSMVITLRYDTIVYQSPPTFYIKKKNRVCPGLVANGRIHLLENEKIDISLDYSYRFLKSKETLLGWNYDFFGYYTFAFSVGVKF